MSPQPWNNQLNFILTMSSVYIFILFHGLHLCTFSQFRINSYLFCTTFLISPVHLYSKKKTNKSINYFSHWSKSAFRFDGLEWYDLSIEMEPILIQRSTFCVDHDDARSTTLLSQRKWHYAMENCISVGIIHMQNTPSEIIFIEK